MKTPQPTPRLSPTLPQGDVSVGTTGRLSSLRQKCLIRDRYRCVISRMFDSDEYVTRVKLHGQVCSATDDDGILLKDEEEVQYLEVTHIIPHVLSFSDSSPGLLVCSLFQCNIETLTLS